MAAKMPSRSSTMSGGAKLSIVPEIDQYRRQSRGPGDADDERRRAVGRDRRSEDEADDEATSSDRARPSSAVKPISASRRP